MVTIRSSNEIILSLIDFFRLVQPDLDTKPGTVGRDLFIDAPASQLAILYDELSAVSFQQSLRLVVGSDLDKLAKNFGLVRKQATFSSGISLLTFASITAPININAGGIIVANNGFSFSVSVGVSVVPSSLNFYKSVAAKYSAQLAFAGITDLYAVEVTATASSAGSAGNIGSYSLDSTSIPSVSNVTNINPFNGGNDQEQDAAFRNRILSAFTGSSVGTSLGYLNTALGVTGVSDAYVVTPSDPLMTRDGSIVQQNADGTLTILSEGTGGKVDVVVLGSNLIQNSDSYIYIDKSNNNNPTNSKNDVVLGQIAADANKTINRKRVDDIANGVLPAQPISDILSVTGSLSGSNFIQQTIDSFGRTSGNYQLIKDTGAYGGSPFGFDKIHWTSNTIANFSEDLSKGQFNGQDQLSFTDVAQISQAQQNIAITNENSLVTSDRSIIQLLHTPATNVTRIFNVNTGERYVITNQNIDATTSLNQSGRVQITGNTLPSPSDILQVDYNWFVSYDRYTDFDGLKYTQNDRLVSDSIDWGLANQIRNEEIVFTENSNFYQGFASQTIDSIINVDQFLQIDGYVSVIPSGTFANRLAVILTNLANLTNTVESIRWQNTNVELFVTAQNNNNISNIAIVVGSELLYQTTIILPSDTVAQNNDKVSVILNSVNVFTSTSVTGSANGNQITIPAPLLNTTATQITLRATYLARVSDLFATGTTALPASRVGNGYLLNNNGGFLNFSSINLIRRENQTVQQNLSSQFYVELNLPATDFDLEVADIVLTVRLSDGYQLWNNDHQGSITIGTDGNYQLIFSGFNTPAVNDKVLVIYYATDLNRFQPFSYSNEIIKSRVDVLAVGTNNQQFSLPLNIFTNQDPIHFTVFTPNTNTILFNITDGYLINNSLVPGTAFISSHSVNFDTLPDLTNQKVQILGSSIVNNNGIYDILSYDINSNHLVITNVMDHITNDQICVVRLLDGQELWNYTGVIDVVNNRLLFPTTAASSVGDKVITLFFRFDNLRQAPTRIISTVSDQIVNTGNITANGLTLALAQDVVFTATASGLKLNLNDAMRQVLSLNSTNTLPSNIKVARLIKAEKVTTFSNTNTAVIQVLATYDVVNTTIQNNLLYTNQNISNPTLLNLDFILPNTANNNANLPKIGDAIRVSFYYTTDNDSESLSYTRNGTLYTNKKFAFINKIYLASGFQASQSTRLTFTSFNQPTSGARYKVFYDYTAPKQNERIVINYDYNKLIGDVTFAIEATRPINADVLVRNAKQILLDLTINVVIADTFLTTSTTVLQNLRNALVTILTTNKLGQIIDTPTIINTAEGIQGIARARILYFNQTGQPGTVSSIQAHNDQYFGANNIVINTETR